MVQEIAFWALAVVIGVSSVIVVAVRNVVHAALGLVGALMGAAGVFLLFGAEFVGLAQILIYVGAVVVLFLFGIMLTASRPGQLPVTDNDQRLVAAGVALGVFVLLAAGILAAFGGQTLELDVAFPTADLGTDLFTRWILPFEAVSILLIAALIGAIVLARRD